MNHRSAYGSASNIMNSVHREPMFYSIIVVPKSDLNSDGKSIDCDVHAFPKGEAFSRTAARLSKFIPTGHIIVKAMCRS
jgi:hypothetical protein